MKKNQIKKLTIAGILVAIGVVCSPFNIPIGVSKCFPIQHFINIISAIFLGPWYAVGAAFSTSFIRNLIGTGSLFAFPGSMFGALLAGFLYKKSKVIWAAAIGEVFGTSIIGAIAAWPLALIITGSDAAAFGFVVPFFISSIGGALLACVILLAFIRTNTMNTLNRLLEN